jgi:hypothetical protein
MLSEATQASLVKKPILPSNNTANQQENGKSEMTVTWKYFDTLLPHSLQALPYPFLASLRECPWSSPLPPNSRRGVVPLLNL